MGLKDLQSRRLSLIRSNALIMKISIHDYANNRVIIAEVPTYLTDLDYSSDDIAQAIMTALGLNQSETEYMIGGFKVNVDHAVRNDNGAMHKIEELTQDFKEDVLSALAEIES